MLLFFVVFVALFLVVAGAGWAIAWGFHSQAEARMWQERHKEVTLRQNHAAWQGNREMVMY